MNIEGRGIKTDSMAFELDLEEWVGFVSQMGNSRRD